MLKALCVDWEQEVVWVNLTNLEETDLGSFTP
jgi:hypothetical protein